MLPCDDAKEATGGVGGGTLEGGAHLQDFVVLLRQGVASASACAGRHRSGSVRVGGPQGAHQAGGIYERKRNQILNTRPTLLAQLQPEY